MDKKHLKIQRPNISNLHEIQNLFSITIQNNFHQEKISDPTGILKEDLVNDLVKTLKKDFESQGNNEFHLIARNSEMIIGVIAFGQPNQIIKDRNPIDLLNTPEIKSVYVHPEFQNTGIGNLLLKNILKRLAEKGYKEFCLDSGYINAQRYWKRKFGTPIKILENYWAPNSHHMIWHVKFEELKGFS